MEDDKKLLIAFLSVLLVSLGVVAIIVTYTPKEPTQEVQETRADRLKASEIINPHTGQIVDRLTGRIIASPANPTDSQLKAMTIVGQYNLLNTTNTVFETNPITGEPYEVCYPNDNLSFEILDKKGEVVYNSNIL